MTCHTHFTPDAKGWVVRSTIKHPDTKEKSTHISWWYGPHHGWGTTAGPLDYSVAVFPTKKEALAAARGYGRSGLTVEQVADAVAFSIAQCDNRKANVLAGNHPDRQRIAESNDRVKEYLQGKRASR